MMTNGIKKSKMSKIAYLHTLILVVILLSFCACDKVSDTNSANSTTITDVDGNVYHSVTIGTQVWMVENLKVTKFRNGETIPNVVDNTVWKNLTNAACCDFDNNAANSLKYGKLYNWYAVNDSRKLAPTGWHVPSESEQTILTDYLFKNGYVVGSGIAKSLASNSGWNSDPTAGNVGNDQATNNKSGYTGLPAGLRWDTGTYGFNYLGFVAFWWNTTCHDATPNANLRSINSGAFFVDTFNYSWKSGLSVRCLHD